MAEWQPEWRFAEMTPAQIAENPVQGEFFTSAADMPERLVREAIQNSMDAALGNQVVRVRFAFSGADHALQTQRAQGYLDGLAPHLNAVADRQDGTSAGTAVKEETLAVYRANCLLDGPLKYLVVEDFGTRGLTGAIRANGASEPGNDFWGFFRQIGISTKSEDAAGSWGLGKWVFPDASQVNAFLALTRRVGENDSLLMGLAILKTHELDGRRYPAYGHYAAADEADDRDWFQMPVAESDLPGFVRAATDDFKLQRTGRSGVSVIILWPKDELTPASIARAVITQYFHPILRGKLEVEIQHPEEEDRIIDADQIAEELGWIDESERDDESEQSLRGLLKLASWAYEQDEVSGHIPLSLPSARWNQKLDEETDLNVANLRERYQRGERLAFQLRTEVRQLGESTPSQTSCWLYLERADELERGHDYFVRGNLRIPNIDHLGKHRARSLLLVDGESPLGHLLRDAEGPAHTEWHKEAERVKDKWARGARSRVDDVRRAPYRLIRALNERPSERQLDALADLFPADIPMGRGSTESEGLRGEGVTTPAVPPEATPGAIVVSSLSGGFRVRSGNLPPKIGSRWRLRMAYDVGRGSKAKAFNQFKRGVEDGCPDFSLHERLNCDQAGSKVKIISHNELDFEITDSDFQLSVRGFDQRDVITEIDPIRAPADEVER